MRGGSPPGDHGVSDGKNNPLAPFEKGDLFGEGSMLRFLLAEAVSNSEGVNIT